MCTVQVLLFAEAMRQPGLARSPRVRPGSSAGVCRRLFEQENSTPGSPDDPSRVLLRMEERIRQTERERWNFDFEREQPLPGRYQWVRVGPPPVSSPSTPRKAVAAEKSSGDCADDLQVVAEVHPRQRKSTASTTSTKKSCAGTAQSKITDFLRQRKRPLETDTSTSVKPKKRPSNPTHRPLAPNRMR